MPTLRFLAGRVPVLSDLGLLVLRLAAATVFLAHGWGIILGPGVQTVIQSFGQAGVPLAAVSAPFTVYIEAFGGILLLFGALTRVLSAGLFIVMAGALLFVHLGEPLVSQDGGSSGLAFMMCAAVAGLLLAGPGRFSIDYLLTRRMALSVRPLPTG